MPSHHPFNRFRTYVSVWKKGREYILRKAPLKTEAEIVLPKGAAAALEVEVQPGKGGISIYSKEHGLELNEASEAVGLAGNLLDLFFYLR